MLIENLHECAVFGLDPDGRITVWSAGAEHLTGYASEDVLGKEIATLLASSGRSDDKIKTTLQDAVEEGRARLEIGHRRRKGGKFRAELRFTPLREGKRLSGFAGVIRDLSESGRAEQALHDAQQRLRLHVQQTPLGVIDWDMEFCVQSWNPAAERIFGYTEEEALRQHISFILPEGAEDRVDEVFRDLQMQQGSGRSSNTNLTKDGRLIHCEWYNTLLVDESGKTIGVTSLVEDDTERKLAEKQSRLQMERLNALRSIDLAITASLDLRVTLTVLLDQVISQLSVDAADILLLNAHTQRLEFAAGRGFRTGGIQSCELLLGEGSAGRAARDRRTVSIPNLRTSVQFSRGELLCGEEFVAHYATPLIAKGQVKGVLEVFHRLPLHPDAGWIGFFEALAGQAAIAVESAGLFEDLQRSNMELSLAYDTTLEGWAAALDLRDSVTEGHTRRVTDLSVRLARALGVGDSSLVHLRRGALLHDIGKMGIPDHILHKKGPLTEEEWEEMRKHPQYAYEMLCSIDFLRPALDIPYCHHERWDGSGYPRGLREEEIPLAARIFAVVDIWDALCSERPYHPPWPESKVREHLRSLAGTHLDPHVVEVFLGLEPTRESSASMHF